MKKALSLAAFAALLAPCLAAAPAAAVECPRPGAWLDPASGVEVSASEAIRRLAEADVALLGESHGMADMQLWEATTAAAVAARRGAVQYAYEMLPRAAQPALDAWAAGETSRHDFLAAARWNAVWGFPADAYDPVLRLPRLQAAPAIALNVDRTLVRRVGRDGWAAVPEGEREGLSDPAQPLPGYTARLDEVLARKAAGAAPGFAERHGDGDAAAEKGPSPEEMRTRFIEAQLVWDRAFAEAIAGARTARPDAPVIAFMGSGHVEYGHGVAHQLADLGVGNVASAVAVFAGPDCAIEPDADGVQVADLVYGLPPAQTEPGPPPRPKIGVYIQDAPDGGAEITRVTEDSPAEAAGFLAGDVVSEAAGRSVKRAAELGAAIRSHNWGAWLPFTVARDGETMELVVKLPKAPPS